MTKLLRKPHVRRSLPASSRSPDYKPFEVTGFELEYSIVDRDLEPQCWVEDALRAFAGRPVSEVEIGPVTLSNELAAHVLELKTPTPERSLTVAEQRLQGGVDRLVRLLDERLGARLLPTGMHPLMDPAQSRLWRRSGAAIYDTYARLFPIRQHGWLNLQSCQINLPFGGEADAVRLYNATACLLPYLPALTAASPLVEGQLGPSVCNRMVFYAANQARIPSIAGDVIPEYIDSLAGFRRDILGSIYRDLDGIPGTSLLRHEWINSRGAILRFDRRALEIRVLDTQECVKMDVAVAAFVRGVLRRMTAALAADPTTLPPHRMLVSDYRATITRGSAARVDAAHLPLRRAAKRERWTARHALEALVEYAEPEVPAPERKYLPLVERRIREGNLSERIARVVRKVRRGAARRAAIVATYGELCRCLEANCPWEG